MGGRDEVGEQPVGRDLRVAIDKSSRHLPDATRRPCHHRGMAARSTAGSDPVLPTLGLPVEPPVSPMLATPAGDEVPDREDLAFEPKWDGFRMLAFRSGERIVLQGRGGDDLSYAFPEVAEGLLRALPDRIVLDGEAIIMRDGSLDFPALGARLRPRSESASIARLAAQSPAHYVAFDVLALGGRALMDDPYLRRRAILEELAPSDAACSITPMTRDRMTAEQWFRKVEGAGLDGLIAKPCDAPYAPGKRSLLKIKHRRSLDAVVAGWRPHAKEPDRVGSLLLGLHDDSGQLHHIGVASGLSAAKRREITRDIEPYLLPEGHAHPWTGEDDVRRPGGANRWNRGREQAWFPLVPHLVAEVSYDQFEGERLRHVATWMRWRPDRSAESCTYAQVHRAPGLDVETVLSWHSPRS